MTVEGLEFHSEVLQQSFLCPVCLSLQCVPAVTLCVSCLFGFALCLCDRSIMKCHLSVKTWLINYMLSECVCARMYLCVCMCDTIESDSWTEVSHYKLSFHPQRSHFVTAHLDDKAGGDVCSNTNQIHILDFY